MLVKLLAVSQISRLLLSVVVRGITKLPVSQLEIVTVAFSTISIATYLCSLWKTKDVEVPIKPWSPRKLLESYPGAFWPSQEHTERTENETKRTTGTFFVSLLNPSGARVESTSVANRIPRIRNDTFRMQGERIPVISTVIAVSTLVFGGLHCIAWSFDFPSRAEVLIWRIASIMSATIPCAAVSGTFLFALPIKNRLRNFKRITIGQNLLPRLQILEQYPPEYWDAIYIQNSLFNEFKTRIQPDGIPFSRLKTTTISFEEFIKPHKESEGVCILLHDGKIDRVELNLCSRWLREFYWTWKRFKIGEATYVMLIYATFGVSSIGSQMKMSLEARDPLPYRNVSLWRLYEAYVGSTFKNKGVHLPHFYLEQHLERDLSAAQSEWSQIHQDSARFDRVSGVLSLIAGILYGLARIALLVIAFTSLRSAPKALYIDSWIRFMANIS